MHHVQLARSFTCLCTYWYTPVFLYGTFPLLLRLEMFLQMNPILRTNILWQCAGVAGVLCDSLVAAVPDAPCATDQVTYTPLYLLVYYGLSAWNCSFAFKFGNVCLVRYVDEWEVRSIALFTCPE